MEKPKACPDCWKDKEFNGLCWDCPKHALIPPKKPGKFKVRKLKKGEDDF